MTRQCMYCERILGTVEPYENTNTTSTICIECYKIQKPIWKKEVEEILKEQRKEIKK